MGRLKILIIFMLSLTNLIGCSSISYNKISTHNRSRNLQESERLKLAKVARSALGKQKLVVGKREFRADCSGTIRAIFAQARVPLGGIIKNNSDNDVKTIYRYVKKYGLILQKDPQAGDLVFFHNTYDRTRNGLLNDALTHIGIVEKVDGSIISFIHHLGHSIIRSRMNLEHPKEYRKKDSNERINHMLRRAQGNHPAFTTAQLFAGFGRL